VKFTVEWQLNNAITSLARGKFTNGWRDSDEGQTSAEVKCVLNSISETAKESSLKYDFQVRHPSCVEYKLKYNIKKYIYNTVIHNIMFY